MRKLGNLRTLRYHRHHNWWYYKRRTVPTYPAHMVGQMAPTGRYPF